MNSIIFLYFLVSCTITNAHVFDITKYGAKGDGATDSTQALTTAWKEACASTSPTTIVVPKGNFALRMIKLEGPCKSSIRFQLQGTLKAPANPSQVKGDGWITLDKIDSLTIFGGGVFDGQGKSAWVQNDCHKNGPICRTLSMNLRLNAVTNSILQDVTTLDSKNFHVNVIGCKNLTFERFKISAAETSINTDGIHIGRSDGVKIINTEIKTGDDCISLGDGSKNINITNITCGPGHGISVGSLGRYKNEEPVVGIYVKNCTITGSQNGVRIKTWPKSEPGVASEMHFEDVTMNGVGTPILIDQGYCPYNQCTAQIPSSVKLSKISFKNIKGTSLTKEAVKLVCSKSYPCNDVKLSDIDLTYSGKDGPAVSVCENIKPAISGKQNPAICSTGGAKQT